MARDDSRSGKTAQWDGSEPKAPAAPVRLGPGDVVDDRYRIEALIGEGGMGSVFIARHVHIGRKVALKVLHPERSMGRDERERFRREAAIAVQLRSPHVVEVLDFGEDPRGYTYYAMELLEGESLRALLERERRVSPERAVRLLRQLLRGLYAAHQAGVVHRDLKPENLWLLGTGLEQRLKILDFGIAKFLQPGASLEATAVASRLAPGCRNLAIPKSRIFSCCSGPLPTSQRFSGFRSRWTTPARWAATSPARSCRRSRTVRSGERRRSRSSRARSDSPSRSSIA